MILRVHTDASYLSVTKVRIIVGVYHFISDNSEYHPDNGPIHNVCKIMNIFMASAAESEIGESFINAHYTVPDCTTIIEMGYPQPPTRIKL